MTAEEIMKLADEYASDKAEEMRLDYETWHTKSRRKASQEETESTRAALLAAVEELVKDAERVNWLATNPVEALEIFGHLHPNEERFIRFDIDAAMKGQS
jgi:hypothetical protein